MSKRILCIGELLIDFFTVEKGVSIQQAEIFEKQAGGAPANVCAAIAKLGGQASFCGKVGDDAFGHFLAQTVEQAGVNIALLVKDARYPTTLAFVSRQMDGERDFIFNRGADEQLTIAELEMEHVLAHDIAHFGSATALLSEPFTSSYTELFAAFERSRAFVSFDPNYRADLWRGNTTAFVAKCMPFLRRAHFVKMSEEELALFSQAETLEERAIEVQAFGMRWLVVTLGARGTLFYDGLHVTMIPSISVQVVDSTGAGDAFVGAVLVQLAEQQAVTSEQLVTMIARANKVGAKVCEKVGAITALPSWQEID